MWSNHLLRHVLQVFADAPPNTMAEKFADLLQFATHVSRLMVTEIRRRASNRSTGQSVLCGDFHIWNKFIHNWPSSKHGVNFTDSVVSLSTVIMYAVLHANIFTNFTSDVLNYEIDDDIHGDMQGSSMQEEVKRLIKRPIKPAQLCQNPITPLSPPLHAHQTHFITIYCSCYHYLCRETIPCLYYSLSERPPTLLPS